MKYFTLIIFISLISYTKEEITHKYMKRLRKPESKKLEIQFQRDGNPAIVESNNEVIKMHSNLNKVKLGNDYAFIPDGEHLETTHSEDITDDGEGISYHEKENNVPGYEIHFDNDRREGYSIRSNTNITVSHPLGEHEETVFSSVHSHPRDNEPKEVFSRDVNGYIHHPNEKDPLPELDLFGNPNGHSILPFNAESDGERIRKIEEEINAAFEKGDGDIDVVIEPHVIEAIIEFLNKLDYQKRKELLYGHQTPEEKIHQYQDLSGEIETKISHMEAQVQKLKKHLEGLKMTKHHDEEIEVLTEHIDELESEEDHLKIEKDTEDEMIIKEKIEELEREKDRLIADGASDEEIAEIDSKIVELQIEDAQEEHIIDDEEIQLETDELTNKQNEIHELKESGGDAEKIEELLKKTENLNDTIEDQQHSHHITEELEEEISDDSKEIAQLKAQHQDPKQIAALESGRESLIEEQHVINKEEQEFKPKVNIHINSMFSNTKKVGHDSDEDDSIIEDDSLGSYTILDHVMFAVNNLENIITELFEKIPNTKDDIPPNDIHHQEELIELYNKMNKFADRFSDFEENELEDVHFIKSVLNSIDMKFEGILHFYDLYELFDDLQNGTADITDEFIDAKVEVETDADEVLGKLSDIDDNVRIIDEFKTNMKDELESLHELNDKEGLPKAEEQAAEASQLAPIIIDLKEQYILILAQLKDDVKFVRKFRVKMANKVNELHKTAFKEEDHSEEDDPFDTGKDTIKSIDYHSESRKLKGMLWRPNHSLI